MRDESKAEEFLFSDPEAEEEVEEAGLEDDEDEDEEFSEGEEGL